jgi:hypothetical protein
VPPRKLYGGELSFRDVYSQIHRRANVSQSQFVGFAYQGKDIVFRFIIDYIVALRDFGP